MTMKNLVEILGKFPEQKVVVIGDVMLDKNIIGNVSRISPEAPVPVLEVLSENYSLGGAANTASNVSSLGAGKVSLFSFIGNDEPGEILKKLCKESKIDLFCGSSFKTTVKERVMGKNEKSSQQFIRLDYEDKSKKTFSTKLA